MALGQIVSYIHIGVAILLGTAILLQQKGAGLSTAFGGEGGFYRTKRGFEKVLFISTIVLAVLFFGIGLGRITLTKSSSPESQLQISPPPGTEETDITAPFQLPPVDVDATPLGTSDATGPSFPTSPLPQE